MLGFVFVLVLDLIAVNIARVLIYNNKYYIEKKYNIKKYTKKLNKKGECKFHKILYFYSYGICFRYVAFDLDKIRENRYIIHYYNPVAYFYIFKENFSKENENKIDKFGRTPTIAHVLKNGKLEYYSRGK